LTAETAAGGVVREEPGTQYFERDVAVEVFVAGEVHDPHAAFADLAEDLVVREPLSDQSEHLIGRATRVQRAARIGVKIARRFEPGSGGRSSARPRIPDVSDRGCFPRSPPESRSGFWRAGPRHRCRADRTILLPRHTRRKAPETRQRNEAGPRRSGPGSGPDTPRTPFPSSRVRSRPGPGFR